MITNTCHLSYLDCSATFFPGTVFESQWKPFLSHPWISYPCQPLKAIPVLGNATATTIFSINHHQSNAAAFTTSSNLPGPPQQLREKDCHATYTPPKPPDCQIKIVTCYTFRPDNSHCLGDDLQGFCHSFKHNTPHTKHDILKLSANAAFLVTYPDSVS